MGAEACAFFVKEKLQSLVDGGGIVCPGLEAKMKDAIGKLEKLSHMSNNHSSSLVLLLTTSMYGLEDALDAYHVKRVKQVIRWQRDPTISLESTTSFHLFPLPSLVWSQIQLNQAINNFLKQVRNVKALSDHVTAPPPPPPPLFTDRARPTWDDVFVYQKDMGMEVIRKNDVNELVSKLLDPEDRELRVLPLVGSRGQGKTEVVMSAYDTTKVKTHFQYRAWVSLNSQDGDTKHTLINLIHQGTMSRSTDLDHMEEADLQDMLFKMLMEKTYLIVIINVCNREAWTGLVIPFPDCHNGSRVVLTTPYIDVSNFVDPLNPGITLQPLNEEESWVLLLKHVNPSLLLNPETLPQYDHLKKIVMQKCKGFSMAISLLGGVLYNKPVSEWEGVMMIGNMEEEEDEGHVFSNMLAFSFHALHPVLKGCLIYMILFPEEVEIPVRRLIRLWLAEGFLNTQKTTLLLPEDAAEICLEELINRKLIEVTSWKLDGSPKTCRMPHLLRDLLKDHKSVQAGLLFNDEYSGSHAPHKLRRFAERSTHDGSMLDLNNKHLHSYLCFNTHIRGTPNTRIGNFLRVLIRKTSFALLRVLDLEGVYKPQLPNTIGMLLLLKFLGLRLTVLDSIPNSISTLPLLETLDLKHTNVNIIPTSIWKSKSLRHLYVNEVRLDESFRNTSAGLLTNFQTIRGLYIVDKRVISNVLERFVNLRKVGITCHHDSVDQVTEWILQLAHLETLKLRSLDRLGKPSRLSVGLKLDKKKILKLYLLGKLENPVDIVQSLPSCLRKLTLSSSKIEENDAMEILGDLPELVILRLLANSYKSPYMTCSTGKFPKLRVLKLWMLPKLQVWKVENGAMPYLEELEIRKCNKIKSLDGLEHLTQLHGLVLTNMPRNLAENIRESCKESNTYIKENIWKFSYYQDETISDKKSSSTPTNSGSEN